MSVRAHRPSTCSTYGGRPAPPRSLSARTLPPRALLLPRPHRPAAPAPVASHLPLRPPRTRPLRRRGRPAFLPLPSAPVAVPPSPAASNSGPTVPAPQTWLRLRSIAPRGSSPHSLGRPPPRLGRLTAASPRAVDDRQALFADKLSPNLIYSSSFLLFINNLLHFHDKLLSLKYFSDKLLFNCHHI